jgi:GDP-L-fucose synthase
MPTNLYGPGDNYSLMNSHVIPAMIRKFHLAKLAAERNWVAIEQDEAKNGPIPEDLKAELLATCNLQLEPAVKIWGSGTPRREFLYNEDMADACVFLMNLPDEDFAKALNPSSSLAPCPLPLDPALNLAPVVNIGVGEDVTIKELAELVKQMVGYEGDIVLDTTKPDGTLRKLMDVGRLGQLGWQAVVGISDGLAMTYRDFVAQFTR